MSLSLSSAPCLWLHSEWGETGWGPNTSHTKWGAVPQQTGRSSVQSKQNRETEWGKRERVVETYRKKERKQSSTGLVQARGRRSKGDPLQRKGIGTWQHLILGAQQSDTTHDPKAWGGATGPKKNIKHMVHIRPCGHLVHGTGVEGAHISFHT